MDISASSSSGGGGGGGAAVAAAAASRRCRLVAAASATDTAGTAGGGGSVPAAPAGAGRKHRSESSAAHSCDPATPPVLAERATVLGTRPCGLKLWLPASCLPASSCPSGGVGPALLWAIPLKAFSAGAAGTASSPGRGSSCPGGKAGGEGSSCSFCKFGSGADRCSCCWSSAPAVATVSQRLCLARPWVSSGDTRCCSLGPCTSAEGSS